MVGDVRYRRVVVLFVIICVIVIVVFIFVECVVVYVYFFVLRGFVRYKFGFEEVIVILVVFF